MGVRYRLPSLKLERESLRGLSILQFPISVHTLRRDIKVHVYKIFGYPDWN